VRNGPFGEWDGRARDGLTGRWRPVNVAAEGSSRGSVVAALSSRRTLRDWTLSALTDHGADGKVAALAWHGGRRNADSGMVDGSENWDKLRRSVSLLYSVWPAKEQAEDQTGWCLGSRGGSRYGKGSMTSAGTAAG
jgi:hypothetical protein